MEELKEVLSRTAIRRNWKMGEKYEVEVIGASKDRIYVDCGDKIEGFIRIEEFIDENGNICVSEKERIEVYYIGLEDGLRCFTTNLLGFSTIDKMRIKEAYEKSKPVEGMVVSEKKGGFEIKVGSVSCFCPMSHIGEKGEVIGKKFDFKVLAFERDGKNIVLSRKALLEEKKEETKRKLKESLKEGCVVCGTVEKITDSGALIDIGGLRAYLPKSEVGWSFVSDLSRFLSLGASIEAKIKEIDWEKERIILSTRELLEDPYVEFSKKYQKGSVIEATLSRILPSGIFVLLDKDVESFVPASRLPLGKKIEEFLVGEKVKVEVLDIDLQKRRIQVAIRKEGTEYFYPQEGEKIECEVLRILKRGILVKTSYGVCGYIPESELNMKGQKEKLKQYGVGSKVLAVVINVDSEKGKLVLSEKKVVELEEKEAYSDYEDRMRKEAGSLWSLGDLLKEKLEK